MEPGWGVGTEICPVVVLVVPKGCGQCAVEVLRKERRAVTRRGTAQCSKMQPKEVMVWKRVRVPIQRAL